MRTESAHRASSLATCLLPPFPRSEQLWKTAKSLKLPQELRIALNWNGKETTMTGARAGQKSLWLLVRPPRATHLPCNLVRLKLVTFCLYMLANNLILDSLL